MGTPAGDYRNWKRSSLAVGCVFARLLANREYEHGQKIVTVGASTTPERIATSVANQVSKLLQDSDVTAACVLLPKVTELRLLVRAMMALGDKPDWVMSKAMMHHPPVGDLVALGLTRNIPSPHYGTLPSEALVFGDFDIFPATRRAPVVALELFVGVPLEFDPKDDVTLASKANLAHILTPSLTASARANMLALSGKARKASLQLAEDQLDLRAKAKVSLVVPLDVARELDCVP